MPQVVKEDIDKLNAILTLTIERSDYESKFNSELRKYQKQAHMKGFRKGKTPLSALKKMYGKGVLGEVINEMIHKNLTDYISDQELNILGQPIPTDDQEKIDFDIKDLQDYELKFELGLAPDFELQGVSEETSLEKYKVEITDDFIQEELEVAQKRLGNQVLIEEGIVEEDLLTLSAKELDGDQIKEGGVENEFKILVRDIADEALKSDVLAKKRGDIVRFNIFNIEKDIEKSYVKKHYLGMEEEDEIDFAESFEAEILEVSRIEPAELNQEFFDKYFGEGAVDNEEDAKSKIRENLENYFNNQAEALLFRDLQDLLIENNVLELPNAFLKRWLLITNEQASEEIIEKEYEAFAKNLQWTLIKEKISKKFDIKIGEEDVIEKIKERTRSYFGGGSNVNEDLINTMAQRLAQDEKQFTQVAEEALSDKIFETLVDNINIVDNPISKEAFEETLEKARAEAEANQMKLVTEEEE